MGIGTVEYGYMPSFGAELVSEIKFASKHFDFVEITYNPDEHYGQERILAIRKELAGIRAIGHLHWGCDFSLASEKEIEKARGELGVFSKLGIKKVTIHPSFAGAGAWDNILRNNAHSLRAIAKFCKGTGISISLENVADAPESGMSGMRQLFAAFPDFAFTLDTGHAEITHGRQGYKKFIANFGQRLSHVHIHYSISGMDHLPFQEKEKMKEIIWEIARAKPNATLTFEIFYKLQNGKRVRLAEEERRTAMLEHLRVLKN